MRRTTAAERMPPPVLALLASPLGLGSLAVSGAATAAGLAVIGKLAAVAP